MTFAWLLGLQLLGTIDRIEGELAVVEWRDGSFSDVPAALLGERATEGDSVWLRRRPHRPMAHRPLAPSPPPRAQRARVTEQAFHASINHRTQDACTTTGERP